MFEPRNEEVSWLIFAVKVYGLKVTLAICKSFWDNGCRVKDR